MQQMTGLTYKLMGFCALATTNMAERGSISQMQQIRQKRGVTLQISQELIASFQIKTKTQTRRL